MKRMFAWVVLNLFLVGMLGCHSKTVSVSGKVVFDGEPGQNICVLFQADSAVNPSLEAATGMTNDRGEFFLSLISNSRKGVMPGEYVVYISWKDPNAAKEPVEGETIANPCRYKIPTRATSGQMRFTVPPQGTREADFIFDSSKETPEQQGV